MVVILFSQKQPRNFVGRYRRFVPADAKANMYHTTGSVLLAVSCLILTCTAVLRGQQETWPPRPEYTEKAKMARYLCHNAQWGVVSAISPEFGRPVGTVQSFADGPRDRSTGIPYFYIADISDTYKNIMYNNTVSLTMSEDEGPHCRTEQLDPEEPLCARLTLMGKMVRVTRSREHFFAKYALFLRHPAMKHWPSGHDWDFYKLQIEGVSVLDYYGGASHVSLSDYFGADPTSN